MPNPWAWDKGRNPYREHSFAVLGVDPEADARAVNQARARVERRIEFAREDDKPRVGGRVLTKADAVQAANRLNNWPDRLEEELLAHRSHRFAWQAPKERLERLQRLAGTPALRLAEPRRLLLLLRFLSPGDLPVAVADPPAAGGWAGAARLALLRLLPGRKEDAEIWL